LAFGTFFRIAGGFLLGDFGSGSTFRVTGEFQKVGTSFQKRYWKIISQLLSDFNQKLYFGCSLQKDSQKLNKTDTACTKSTAF
jgi:hypothetical protein